MLVYYLGLIFIFILFLGFLFFLIKKQPYSKIQLGYIGGIILLAITVMGVGYYRYGAINGLQSLYAYREIHFLLTDLQKNPTLSSYEIQQALEKLYKRLPQTEPVHAKMGEVYLALNESVQAELAYAAALKLNASNRDTLYGFYYAQSLRYQGILPHGTISALSKLILEFPKDNGFLNLLAVNSFQTKEYAKAIEYWQKIESNNPEERSLIQLMIIQAQSQLDQAA